MGCNRHNDNDMDHSVCAQVHIQEHLINLHKAKANGLDLLKGRLLLVTVKLSWASVQLHEEITNFSVFH
jgi:hypothetical protein